MSYLLACNGSVPCGPFSQVFLLSGDIVSLLLVVLALRYLEYRRIGAGLWITPAFYLYVLASLFYGIYLSTTLSTLASFAWVEGALLSWGVAALGGAVLGWAVGGRVSLARRVGQGHFYKGGSFLVGIQELLLLPQAFIAAVDLSVVLANFPSAPTAALTDSLALAGILSAAFFVADAFYCLIWPSRVLRRAHALGPV